jgi:bisphosphoglycerate-independent phosphoglycerate mutase (AlkP superfamily)
MTKRKAMQEALQEMRDRADAIIAMGKSEPGEAHSQEDALYAVMLEIWCPPELYVEVKRLQEADFPRWYE